MRYSAAMSASVLVCLLALSSQTKYSVPLQVSVRSDTPIMPMFHQARAYVAYELEMVNYDPTPAHLTKISVTDEKGKPIQSFSGQSLRDCLKSIGGEENADPTTLEPGRMTVAFLWLSFPSSAIPKKLGHMLTFNREGVGPPTVSSALLPISEKRGVIVQPPLEGTNWIACTGPSNTSAHRRARMSLYGHAAIGQRFAIDWLKVDGEGRTFKGPEDRNESYFAYGKNVLACADAMVVEVVDGLKENVPHGEEIAVVITPRTLPGNHVILNLGHGLFAAYAHMIPGSIRVKEGQRVKVGQVLGKLGNSGNSAEPHLHFQIMNAPNFVAAEGLPFGHPLLTIQPTEVTAENNNLLFKLMGKRVRIRNQMPLENDWVAFPK